MSIKTFLSLSGGMNFDSSPMTMRDDECEIIENYTLDNFGSLTKRKGLDFIKTNALAPLGQIVDAVNILNMYFFKDSQGTDYSNVLVACNDGASPTNSDIYCISSNAWAKTKENDTSSAIPHFFTFVDYVFRVNGANAMSSTQQPAGGTWSTDNCLATLLPKYGCVFQDRIYALNDNSSTKYPSRIYWSSLPPASQILTWDTTNDYADINPDDNDQITWGEPFGQVMLIFKEKALYRWTFGQVEADKVPGTQGTPQGMTVKQTRGICFFTNKYGVWALTNPYGIPQLISQKIQSFIDAIPTLTDMRAEVDHDHYKLFIGDVTVDNITYSNCMLVYTISKESWHIETYLFKITAMARFELKTLGNTPIYDDIYLGDNDGQVYRTNTGTTDYLGTTAKPISGKIVTKEYLLHKFPYKTNLKKIWILAKYGIGSRVNFRLDRTRDKGWNSVCDITERITEKNISGKGRTIQFSITDNSTKKSQTEGFLIEDVEEKNV